MWVTELQVRMQPVKPLPLRYPSMPSLSWVNHWLLWQGPLANTTHCKGAPRTRGGHNSKTPDSDAAFLKNVCGTILSLLKKAEKCVCTIPKGQRNMPSKENKPNINHKARFWNQIYSRQAWELNRNPPGNTSLLKLLKAMKQWTKLAAWCWITSRMPWGPTLETDSKSESNEIWIKLVTTFWRHNGAAMVPQSAPPGLYPLVKAHMNTCIYIYMHTYIYTYN